MAGPVQVIGIDDFAWKRGQRYGTVVCDLEQRRIIDLLPDREPATVTAWLADHPEITLVCATVAPDMDRLRRRVRLKPSRLPTGGT